MGVAAGVCAGRRGLMRLQDARTFVRNCKRSFDVVVVDLYQGDSTPNYPLTLEFFSDIRRCIRDSGDVVMNAFFDDYDNEPNRRLQATIPGSLVVRCLRKFLQDALLVGVVDVGKYQLDSVGAAPRCGRLRTTGGRQTKRAAPEGATLIRLSLEPVGV